MYIPPDLLSRGRKMVSYRQRLEEKKKKEEWRGHNHPIDEKCGQHCPRNEHYEGPVKKRGFFA